MPAELGFGAALLVGLLGSSHCIGMCGGIVGALGLGIEARLQSRPPSLLLYHLSYNLGRIGSYVLIGLAAGALGGGLARFGISPVAGKLFAAAFMIALGLYLAGWWRGLALLERAGLQLWRLIRPFGARLMPVRRPAQALLLGALWGWLPCGLVYAAVAWSLTSGSALDGAILMLGFGLGTLPALLLAGNALQLFGHWVRAPAVRAGAGAMMIALGLYTAYQGLGAGAHGHVLHQQAAASVASPPPPAAQPLAVLAPARAPASFESAA